MHQSWHCSLAAGVQLACLIWLQVGLLQLSLGPGLHE